MKAEKIKFKEKLFTWLFSRFPAIAERWAESFDAVKGEGIPWTPFEKPLAECRVALVTTAGVHLKSQTPFDMDNESGDATSREIPGDIDTDKLMVTHKYYDHSSADKDINVVFPLDRLREMVTKGEVGEVAPHHYSFMGHIVDGKIEELMNVTAPVVARNLLGDGVDAVLLTPG
jgi:D-proline reductase (dithiol) PrdB